MEMLNNKEKAQYTFTNYCEIISFQIQTLDTLFFYMYVPHTPCINIHTHTHTKYHHTQASQIH